VVTFGNGAPSASPVPLRYREIDFDACIAMVQSGFINKNHPMGPEIMSNICCAKTPSIVGAVSTTTATVSRCPRNRWNRSARMRTPPPIHEPRSLNWYQRTVEAMKLLLNGPTPLAAASSPLQECPASARAAAKKLNATPLFTIAASAKS
jgi:hypothetical protein